MNIEDLIKNAPEEFLDEDELIDYITSNYDGQFPEDNDSDEIWAEFYADGSPFRSYEDALRKGLKGRIKLSEEPSEDESDEPHDEKTVKEAVKSKEPSDKKVEKILDKIGTQVMDNVIDEHINKTRKAGASFKPHSEEAVQAMLEANKKGTVLSDATVKNIVGTLSQYRW